MKLTNKRLAAVALLACAVFAVQAATNDEIAKRLEPVGKVCVQGKECPRVQPIASAGAGAGKSPDDVIGKYCTVCHSTGMLGAPKIGDGDAWKKRADEQGGLDGLLAKAISGVNAMPPKGTCADCSDAELKGAIEKMSGLK